MDGWMETDRQTPACACLPASCRRACLAACYCVSRRLVGRRLAVGRSVRGTSVRGPSTVVTSGPPSDQVFSLRPHVPSPKHTHFGGCQKRGASLHVSGCFIPARPRCAIHADWTAVVCETVPFCSRAGPRMSRAPQTDGASCSNCAGLSCVALALGPSACGLSEAVGAWSRGMARRLAEGAAAAELPGEER